MNKIAEKSVLISYFIRISDCRPNGPNEDWSETTILHMLWIDKYVIFFLSEVMQRIQLVGITHKKWVNMHKQTEKMMADYYCQQTASRLSHIFDYKWTSRAMQTPDVGMPMEISLDFTQHVCNTPKRMTIFINWIQTSKQTHKHRPP